MRISIVLRCTCGTEIEEIPAVVCEKEFPGVLSHRHGKCSNCDNPMICVSELPTPRDYHMGNA